MSDWPLVTIGIPTFNRPDLLRQAIQVARTQSYENLEIIISDNASTDPEVERVCLAAVNADKRIRYLRLSSTVPVLANFENILIRSVGEYFIWFADDDWRTNDYIEQAVMGFQKHQSAALVVLETRYETPKGPFHEFPQSRYFYNFKQRSQLERVVAAINYSTDNFIYGLFRRTALFHKGHPVTHWIGSDLNEHPFFAIVAYRGEFLALPQIGYHKRAAQPVCENALWEHAGGFHPLGPDLNVRGTIRGHASILRNILTAYKSLGFAPSEYRRLRLVAAKRLWLHAVARTVGWKPLR